MMNEINVISGDQSVKGEKIRYIEFNKIKYFIYTLNEKDDEGYEKLYINKIIEDEEDVITESEWEELKKNIPTIVKEIRNKNITSFKDLNIADAKKCNLNYAKAFKLKINIVDSIKKEEEKNEKVDIHSELNNLLNELNAQEKSISELDSFLDKVDESNVGKPINPDNRQKIEIENLNKNLEEEKKKNEMLQNKVTKLEKEVEKYKNKLEQIKIMIEQS